MRTYIVEDAICSADVRDAVLGAGEDEVLVLCVVREFVLCTESEVAVGIWESGRSFPI